MNISPEEHVKLKISAFRTAYLPSTITAGAESNRREWQCKHSIVEEWTAAPPRLSYVYLEHEGVGVMLASKHVR